MPLHPNTADRGDTLIEILMALVVLGIAGLTLLANLSTVTSVSSQYQNLAEMNAVVRGMATSVQYQIENIDGIFSCSDSSVTNPSTDVVTYYNATLAGLAGSASTLSGLYTPPSNYSAAVTGATFWDPTQSAFVALSDPSACPPVATESQQLTITVTYQSPSLTFSRSTTVIVSQPTRPLDTLP